MLLPGCGCCVSFPAFPCPRPCASEFRYISVRFQHAAGSGNPIATTLPVDVIGDDPLGATSRPWSPPDVPSTVSFDAVDETIVIDTFETPGYTISGTYGLATVGGPSECFASVGFFRQVEIGKWRHYSESSGFPNTWSSPLPFYEAVSLSANLPWISPQGGSYDISTSISWNTRQVPISAQYSWARTQTPASGNQCTAPTSWGQSSLAVSGVAHLEEFTKPGNSNFFSTKYFVPYSNSGGYGVLERYFNYSGLPEERLVWRRLLPDPTITISVSS